MEHLHSKPDLLGGATWREEEVRLVAQPPANSLTLGSRAVRALSGWGAAAWFRLVQSCRRAQSARSRRRAPSRIMHRSARPQSAIILTTSALQSGPLQGGEHRCSTCHRGRPPSTEPLSCPHPAIPPRASWRSHPSASRPPPRTFELSLLPVILRTTSSSPSCRPRINTSSSSDTAQPARTSCAHWPLSPISSAHPCWSSPTASPAKGHAGAVPPTGHRGAAGRRHGG
jgi:hypothetical protein